MHAGEPITVFHNPACSKNRTVVALLDALGAAPTLYEYLKQRPDAEALRQVMRCLAIEDPRQMMRRGEAVYVERNLDAVGPEELIQAMVECPELIERPIVIQGDRAIIARPPELVREFIAATGR
jgi:arsenate reductase